MHFISDELEAYCLAHTSPEDDILYQLNRETHLKILRPRMLSGHLQGKLLKMFSDMIKPEYVLEIGTYTAYASICLAHGLKENGILHTIEINPELEDFLQPYLDKAGLTNNVKLIVGNALDEIPKLNYTYDLVFIDADKENYPTYLDLVIPKVRKGGFIIADNVLWSGKVLCPDSTDKDTQSIVAFNTYVQNHSQLENILLPFRDGLMIMKKL